MADKLTQPLIKRIEEGTTRPFSLFVRHSAAEQKAWEKARKRTQRTRGLKELPISTWAREILNAAANPESET